MLAELESLVGLGDVKDQMEEIIVQVDFNLRRANQQYPRNALFAERQVSSVNEPDLTTRCGDG